MSRVILVVITALLTLGARFTWDVLSEGPSPAKLKDCPSKATITVNKNNGTGRPWSRFCYWGNS